MQTAGNNSILDGIGLWAVDLRVDAEAMIDAGHRHGLMLAGSEPSADLGKTAARTALRLILATHVGLDAARAPFVLARTGKPSLAPASGDVAPPLHFNLAHSETTALVAVSHVAAVGVDIEEMRQPRISAQRRERLITAARAIAPFDALAETSDHAQLLQAWVRLEARAKATGEGLGALLGRLDEVTAPTSVGAQDAGLIVRDVALGRPGLWAAVAASSATLAEGPPPAAAWINAADLEGQTRTGPRDRDSRLRNPA